MAAVLIVDDDKVLREGLAEAGYTDIEIRTTSHLSRAWGQTVPTWGLGLQSVDDGLGSRTAVVGPRPLTFYGALGRAGAAIDFHSESFMAMFELAYLRSGSRNIELVGGAFTMSFGRRAPKLEPVAEAAR